jgi:DNA topoisomerase-1
LKLVIVESPAKAKTIGKFLGKDYVVVASYGHVRDLPGAANQIPEAIKDKPWARMAVDIDNNFEPVYVVQPDSKKHIAELRRLLKDSDEVVLATDEDREGESISWHLLETLKPKVPVSRIAFHEITKAAIDEAIAHPREVNMQLVRAQESRRVLDRLFGYSLSPVLWKKVRTSLSAGRVQSVAVRLVVEREEERRAFRTAEYWDITAKLSAAGVDFEAALTHLDGQRIASGKDFDATTGLMKAEGGSAPAWLHEPEARQLASGLAANVPWRVVAVDSKQSKMSPAPPFITSTLQQSASSLLGLSPRQSMQIAQRLYEGVDMGAGEREGLITYMRTDSVTLSDKALAEAAGVVKRLFGEDYHRWRQFKTKSKNAQEAHEAIRPTSLARTPEQVARYLSGDDLRLYRLIWNRTLASQMADAQLDKTTVDFEAKVDGKTATLRANGSVVTFPGFLKVADSAQTDTELPAITVGQEAGGNGTIALNGTEAIQHKTKPPARYTEAALIRRLEEDGIGRPSTYAPTIGTIQAREYVEKRGNALAPTYLGIAVTLLLRKHFAEYVDLRFTARMEDKLDDIADGNADMTQFLTAFYRGSGEFGVGLAPHIEKEMPVIDFPNIPVGEVDGQPVVVRLGRTAPFLQRGEGGEGNVVSVPADIPYDELSEEKAIELFAQRAKANEPIGQDPATGLNVYKMLGPYGPYVQLGEQGEDKKKKPKRSSLPKGTDLEKVDFALAMRYLSLPRTLGEHPETGKKIAASLGRFGPYIVHDGDFRSIPKTDNLFDVTLPRALEIFAQPKGVRATSKKLLRAIGEHPVSGAKVELYEGRYGAYVSDGTYNATIPKDTTPEAVTLDQAVGLLAEAAERKPSKKKAAAKSKAKAKAAPKKKAAAKPKAKVKPKAKPKS